MIAEWTGARLGLSAVLLVAVLAVCTSAAAADASSKTPSPPLVAPTTTTYTVDGRPVTMVCHGRGSIPVIFQAGGDDPGSRWDSLLAALGPDVLTCIFDRPGVGASAPSPTALTPRAIGKTLSAVLAQAHLGHRFVLVGHSIGGLNALVFGAMYPKKVAGAVLFDPSEAAFFKASHAESILDAYGYDASAVYSQIDAVKRWPSVPLLVLSADPQRAIADGTAAPLEQIWVSGAKRYTRLTPKGRRTVVPGTTHYVFIDEPQIAADAITRVVAQVT